MTDYDRQRDIDAEGQRAAIYHAARKMDRVTKRHMGEQIPRGAAVNAVIIAAVEEYNLRHHTESDEERRGRRSAVRGMLVRLGIYEHFDTALEIVEGGGE